MAQRLLNVRVRPPRIAVLIDRDAKESDLLLAFEFFSKIWGGRFGQILAVEPKVCDSLTEFRLAQSRPEFIYGIGLDDEQWHKTIRRVCQPRGYGILRSEFVKEIRKFHHEEYYLVEDALLHLFRDRDKNKSRKHPLRLVTPKDTSTLSAYCAATFGTHHQNLRDDLYDLVSEFTSAATTDFVTLATEFAKDWQQSWLDVTGHELNPAISESGLLVPTIVLVDSKVQDLALFWNLRTASDTAYPAWIIPIPGNSAKDPAVLQKLKEWILAFLPYGARSNFCKITSQTIDELSCGSFAAAFQAVLTGTEIKAVDYQPPPNRLPVVVPYEYETAWAVEVVGRKLTIQPPKPKKFAELESNRAWIVDFREDVKTGRAIKELRAPSSPAVFELLNGPCPPHFEHSAIPRTGVGTESINVRCSGTKEVINIHLPTSEEILEEILHEAGLGPLFDEKRSIYLPVIKRLGGLQLAGWAFTGKLGAVLTALEKQPRTLEEIKGLCQLGNGILPGKSYLEKTDWLFQDQPDRTKRIGRRRFARYAKNLSPENLKLTSVLEFWADLSVLSRQWNVPCSRCNRSFFEPRLNIQKRVLCSACGTRVSLPKSVSLGYSLHRHVELAIKEGIVPVVLTGRFLHRMTNRGFLWLPGVKYKCEEKLGDIDLLACCDGHLVFCECKRLEVIRDDKVWDEVVNQFLETAAIAKRCNGRLVVLSSQAASYPQEVQDRIKAELGTSIPYLLLDKKDLEKGQRGIQEGTLTRALGFYDVLPRQFPEPTRQNPEKPRMIQYGVGHL